MMPKPSDKQLVKKYKPFYDALFQAHNGYNEDMFLKPPRSPKAALKELLKESEELGRIEVKLMVLSALGYRNNKTVTLKKMLSMLKKRLNK